MKEFSIHSLLQDLRRSLPPGLRELKVIEQSLLLAFRAHEGQFRESKRSGLRMPYIVHPVGVAKLVAGLWVDGEFDEALETMVCVALMHDILEDTTTQYADIQAVSSTRCAELVRALTKPPVNNTEDRDERNVRFIEQIKRAGPSAVYLKICDCLHNLSHPTTMSGSLLRKTIGKARGPYRGLLQETPFEARLLPELQRRIDAAQEVQVGRTNRESPPATEQLHEYLDYLNRRATGKQLELHDLVEILSGIPGALRVVGGDLEECVTKCASLLDAPLSTIDIERVVEQVERAGECDLRGANEKGVARERRGIVFHGCRLRSSHQIWACAAFAADQAPQWLNPASFNAVVGILAERMENRRLGEALRIDRRLLKEVARDPETLGKTDLSQHDATEIASVLDLADLTFLIAKRAIEDFCSVSKCKEQIDRVEGRVKTLASVLRKSRDRHIAIQDVDDLVGFRVIVLGTTARDLFTEELVATLTGRSASMFSLFTVDAGSIVVEQVSSESGYVATHIRVAMRTAQAMNPKIRCEFQVRTIQQDAWARISHIVAYKKRTLSKRRSQELLRELAQLRDDADRRLTDAQREK